MKGSMKILMVSPEVAPFARTADLGDVGGALPKMLKEMGGPKVLSLELFNQSYWEQDALKVAKSGLKKMKTAVKEALK